MVLLDLLLEKVLIWYLIFPPENGMCVHLVRLVWFDMVWHVCLRIFCIDKGIVSRDFGVLFLFIWIDIKFLIGPDQVYFSFQRSLRI
jgi:hypothetical protein